MVKTRADDRERVFSLRRTADRPGLPAFIAGAVERLLGLEYMGREYLKFPDLNDSSRFLKEVFDRLDVRIEVSESDLPRVPRKGPTIVVANHPFGGIDGMAAALVLRSLRPDVKVLANAMLGRIPEMADLFFLVDIFGGQDAARRNVAVLRQARRWLADGGMMVVFPAGEVAHFNLKNRRVVESPWDPAIGRMIRDAGCTVVPIWFGGSNGPLLQIASLIHPLLRTALLPRALLARRGEVLLKNLKFPGRAGSHLQQLKRDHEGQRHHRVGGQVPGDVGAEGGNGHRRLRVCKGPPQRLQQQQGGQNRGQTQRRQHPE